MLEQDAGTVEGSAEALALIEVAEYVQIPASEERSP